MTAIAYAPELAERPRTRPRRRKRDKLKVRRWARDRYRRRRRIAVLFVAILWGHDRCNACGELGPFDIDHVNRDTKRFRISMVLSFPLRVLWHELRKCQLLCLGCHLSKTVAEDPDAVRGGGWRPW